MFYFLAHCIYESADECHRQAAASGFYVLWTEVWPEIFFLLYVNILVILQETRSVYGRQRVMTLPRLQKNIMFIFLVYKYIKILKEYTAYVQLEDFSEQKGGLLTRGSCLRKKDPLVSVMTSMPCLPFVASIICWLGAGYKARVTRYTGDRHILSVFV